MLPDADSDDPKAQFATGFLKVTPAHDPNDWEIGLRHDLPVINVFAPDGTISDQHGWPEDDFKQANQDAVPLGLDRYEARKAIVDWFDKSGLLEETRPYRHAVGHSYRSHVPIEPYLSDQWYVKVTDDRLASAALRAMAKDPSENSSDHTSTSPPTVSWEGQLRFHPSRYAKTFRGWHENIRDWCISRQLWWGHQIPVWTKHVTDPLAVTQETLALYAKWHENPIVEVTGYHITDQQEIDLFTVEPLSFTDPHYIFVCLREDDSNIIAELETAGFIRDPDVLDTWFSSALWPFSTHWLARPSEIPPRISRRRSSGGARDVEPWPSVVYCP